MEERTSSSDTSSIFDKAEGEKEENGRVGGWRSRVKIFFSSFFLR